MFNVDQAIAAMHTSDALIQACEGLSRPDAATALAVALGRVCSKQDMGRIIAIVELASEGCMSSDVATA